MKKIILTLIIFLLNSAISFAQTERLFTVDFELPNSLISALAQDSIGNIWIGTENGLCKYDGAKFTKYFHNADDSTSLLSNHVSDIFVTSKGQVLIGTQNGLQIYEHDYNRFKKVKLTSLGKEPVSIHVAAIKSLKNGDLIIGTLGNGLLKVEQKNWIGKTAVEKKRSEMFLRLMDVCSDNSIWIGAAREGAWHGIWDNDSILKLTMVPGSEDWKIEDVVSDKQGNAYYATQNGVYKVSGKDLKYHHLLNYNNEKIPCLELVGDGLLLIGTEGSGILGYDIKEDKLTDHGFNTGRTDISQTKVRDMLIDRNDNLWAGLYQKGVLVCQSHSSQFDYIGKGSATADFIGAHSVMALYQSPDETLWVVSDKDGL